ncbi:MAG: NAD-glutamate dehydrogenase [Spiribacter sp.]|nr:NAD-glutamate dehydrogenase [Spiribacter sp.]
MHQASAMRARRIEELLARVESRWPAAQQRLIQTFLKHYHGAVSTRDLNERDTQNLYGAALSHWALAQTRTAGRARVQAYNPDPEQNGWESTHTVVQIVTDDQPFLVDSVSMALNELGLIIHLIVHPVLQVARDERAMIQSVGAEPSEPGQAEAWIQFEVDRQSETSQLEAIEKAVEAALHDVAVTVADWQPMRQAAQRAIRGLRRHSPAVDDDYLDEIIAFLEWVLDDHFTFLGYRRYDLRHRRGDLALCAIAGTGLGLLRETDNDDHASSSFELLPPSLREQATDPDPLLLTKSSHRATVHRRGYMDSISVKRFNARGEVVGEHRFLGLYTSAAYSRSPRNIPLLRRRVAAVLAGAGLRDNSHAGKALAHILENYPRDELFQTDIPTLRETALGILELQERQRVRLFVRHDRFGRFVSCLIYAPRDRYDTEIRQRMQAILMRAFGGEHSEFTVQLSEAVLARIHFVIHLGGEPVEDVDHEAVEAQIAATTRSWSDDLGQALLEHDGEARGTRLHQAYGDAVSAAYREDTSPRTAAQDINRLESLDQQNGLAISLYRPLEAPAGSLRLKLYHTGEPISLSAVLPVLEHMGVQVMDERPYGIYPKDRAPRWIHDFGLQHDPGRELDAGTLRDHFQAAFAAIWRGETDDDGFNGLILSAGLSWQEITILRAYAQYLRQAGTPYSQPYIEETLAANPTIAANLVALFEARFDPQRGDAQRADDLAATIEAGLDEVSSLDEDRILRRMLAAIQATLRTNRYRQDDCGAPRDYLALKLRPGDIPGVPKPVPAFEIFVSSPRVEGVHLRGGQVARGGLRWSDRREDYRTEVLGLMKAQMVKNAVIVPVGAKGGFVCKQLPKSRAEQADEVLACYQMFIRGLLDVTDNIVDDQIQPPPGVVRYDDDDPYLVVAADKGTATFSDDANAIAEAYDFWLHDAFASGGSTGYDHKKMGITARGAWVAVQRHFREMGRDIQRTPVTAVGVGDMSGDVFGNGMLQSRTLRLIAAFDHRHIFIDPDPDADAAFAERERLFGLTRSTWDDYDRARIATGGGVWPRTAKSIALSEPARAALGISAEQLTPNELIQAILKAPVDLLWNGGIGTYIKAEDESDADVGDKGNDAVRVDAENLRCQVIGEGGNLGITALGRVAFALAGGRVNSDAIDNSGGVDCSDHEVNIKILVNGVVDDGELTVKQRNRLLADMTEAVADHVLANNYRQTQGLSLMQDRAAERLDEHARAMRTLEREGRLDRVVEELPDDETLTERQQQGLGLTRPELSILLAYTKIRSYEALLQTELVQGEEYLPDLIAYFPGPLQTRCSRRIDQHPLRREIIATNLVNHILNRMGATFLMRVTAVTGADTADAARAFVAARELYGLRTLWHDIDALDHQISADHQHAMLHALCDLQERATIWMLRRGLPANGMSDWLDRASQTINTLEQGLPELLAEPEFERLEARRQHHIDAGAPDALAQRISRLPTLYDALDIAAAAANRDATLEDTARIHFGAAHALGLETLREAIHAFIAVDDWQVRFRGGLLEGLHDEQRRLTETILAETAADPAAERIEQWMTDNGDRLTTFRQSVDQISGVPQPESAMLGVAMQELRALSTDHEERPA